MDKQQIEWLVFIIIVVLALILDLFILSKNNKEISIKEALWQSIFWIVLSFAFVGFVWYTTGPQDAVLYISAYLLEKSLSIDNIFVFVIIFSYFRVKSENISRVLLLGILMAIVFRIVFIAIGSELVARFGWIMYIFGLFLVYTGYKMLRKHDDEEFDPENSAAYKLIRRFLPTTNEDPKGKFTLRKNGKLYFTSLSVVVFMLGMIDVIFAIDSIPAVFSIIPDPSKKILIYSSNIFAVLGLRSLFFLLKGAASRFDYLQQGIAIVLVYIGVKMLIHDYVKIPIGISLAVIVICIVGSIWYSNYHRRKGELKDDTTPGFTD